MYGEYTAHMRRDRRNDRENNSKSKRHAPKPVWSPANALFIETIYVLSSVSALAWARDLLEFTESRVKPRVERSREAQATEFTVLAAKVGARRGGMFRHNLTKPTGLSGPDSSQIENVRDKYD